MAAHRPSFPARPARARRRLVAAAAATLTLALVLAATPAQGATTSRWADWSFAGTAGAYTGSVEVAAAPALAAAFTSTSRGGGVGVISGASTWLAEGTPVGAKYGSSRDEPYVNLRPRADTQTGASRTTYTFDTPTPVSGWTFVLGDIDADAVVIRAIGPDGAELAASDLGFRGGFNYCAPGVAGKPSCTGSTDDVPVWDAATRTLTGNAGAVDTSGAAAWFEPSAPIASLTFDFVRRAGFPVYQTWFASLARDVGGTVSDQNTAGPAAGVLVRLLTADGALVGETSTDATGAYAFAGVTATSGYVVEVVPPPGRIAVGVARAPVDLASTDAVVPFTIRDIVPVPVSGALRDADGAPLAIADVPVSLTDGATTLTTVTASDGTWLLDAVPVGTWTASIAAPDGYALTGSPAPIVVPAGSESPLPDRDFTLTAFPTLGGTVSADGAGLAGAGVTASGATGTYGAVTAEDGTYAFERIPPGEYDVQVAIPDGYTGEAERSVTVGDDDVVADFALVAVRSGVVTGTVTADGAGVAGAQLAIVRPGVAPVPLSSDDTGGFAVDGIPPGDYELVLTVPEGYVAAGPATVPFTITAAGETVEVAFVLAAAPAPTPTPTPTPAPPPGATPAPGGAGTLPATGAAVHPAAPAWAATSIVVGVVLLVVGAARRSRVR